MSKKTPIGRRIASAQKKLEALRARHSVWHPQDKGDLDHMRKQLIELRQNAELARFPAMKRFLAYCLRSEKEIERILTTDKTLPEKPLEHRTLLEKLEFYRAVVEFFVPHEKAIEAAERVLDENLKDPAATSPYPHSQARFSRFGIQ